VLMEEKGNRPVLTIDNVKSSFNTIKAIWKDFHRDPALVLNKPYDLRGSCFNVRYAGAGQVMFIELLDGSTVSTLQCVCDKNEKPELEPLFEHVSRGATVHLHGNLITSPAAGQPIELHVSEFSLFGKIADPEKYPLGTKSFLSRDFLRQIPHQRYHTKLFLAIQIIKQMVYASFHKAMGDCGIGECQPTLITSNECEEGAHPFTVTTLLKDRKSEIVEYKEKPDFVDFSQDFFGKKVYLTVSSQLHLEATVLGSKRDGYCMTTAFRAEPSKGPLHLAEFCMPEWEIISGGLTRNMSVAQYSLQYCFSQILEHCRAEVEFLDQYRIKDDEHEFNQEMSDHKARKKALKKQDWVAEKTQIEAKFQKKKTLPSLIARLERYATTPFIVSSHEECVRLMLQAVEEKRAEFKELPKFDDDFNKEHEFYITEVLFGGLPVFVRYYPKKIKAFYMPVVNPGDEIERVDCYDLLFPYVGEVVGGSQRIHIADDLVARMQAIGMQIEPLQWYVDLRKDASLPHGGAGLGIGRLMIVISGIFNIKDMQEFPRAFAHACLA